MCAPGLNTLFFMGYIVLFFYQCDYVQGLVAANGAANPLVFVALLVGVQGVAAFLVRGLLGGIVARAVERKLKYARPAARCGRCPRPVRRQRACGRGLL